ncbi:aminotransferase class I and II [Flavobacterium sp. MFBS3-15]|uniref:HipA family kinase n=1 Tax=Flavobacterium sp. MFBS3-15 TaxID=2989816 RepID=UPI002235779C|nr:HipA family kinase [Flavobacterium sp. MFBS3-15]MCW4467871.1 aminotransferase class I and II [Flavobacterium sp. MFBS3-15]
MAEIRQLRTVNVTRYVTPLREGGSLPAIAEADDSFNYVLKFRGAGHGTKALIAELIGGEIARILGLPVPELVFANLDEAFGRTEADEEIQDLLRTSQGLNLALHYLSGAINFDPVVTTVEPKMASQIVWLDAFITNVDRTFRNTNMLIWHRELWLIDHGASLYFHHSFEDPAGHAKSPFAMIKDHVLLPQASLLDEVDKEYKIMLTDNKLRTIVSLLPDNWLQWEGLEQTPDEVREVYFQFLTTRLNNSQIFVNQAQNARQTLI